MIEISRLIPISSSAVVATFSLFYIMQSLVIGDELQLSPIEKKVWINYIAQPDPVEEARIKDRLTRPEETEIIERDDLLNPRTDNEISDPEIINVAAPVFEPKLREEISLTQMDGDRIPLVRVAPQYPRRCQERGISGWVVMDFDVNKFGAVENPSVVASDPSACFNRSALKTILRFRYKPTIIDGQPHASTGVRFRMVYAMDEG